MLLCAQAGAAGGAGVQQLCAVSWASLTHLDLSDCGITHQVSALLQQMLNHARSTTVTWPRAKGA